MKELAAIEAGAIDVEVPSKKGVAYGEVASPKPKISRRKCACLTLATAASLVLVSLLAAAYLMTTLRRGATTPREVELFLNQVRHLRARVNRRSTSHRLYRFLPRSVSPLAG